MDNHKSEMNLLANRMSRRRLLALAGGASAAAVAANPTGLLAQQSTPAATPGAATPATNVLPLPSTLAADASPEFRAVAEALAAAMQQHHIPGAALGILAGDREEHVTLGIESLSSLRPVTPETLFQIGSLTKTYTSTAIWRLIDEGALKLDGKVRTWLPDLKLRDEATAENVAVSNLLDHSAGWYGDEGFDTGSDDDALARYVAERLPVLPQLFPLGEFFSYNNAAFQVLGRLLEVATGTTYNAAMADLLLAPLGLADTLLEHDAVLQRPYADGHAYLPINGQNALTVLTPLWVPRAVDPAGGIWATTRDVLRYARFHLDAASTGGPATLVQPASLRQMQEPAIAIPGLQVAMGRDWFIWNVGGSRAIGHGGDTLGQHTEFIAIPDKGFAFILLTNGQPGGTAAATAVLDAALGRYSGLGAFVGKLGLGHAGLTLEPEEMTLTGASGTPAAQSAPLSPATLAEYAGRYADPGTEFVFSVAGDHLEVTATQIAQPGSWQPAISPPAAPTTPLPVSFVAKDKVALGTAVVPFIRDAAGRVGWVSVGLRLIPRTGSA